jgi:D-glycero-D-manno-heptose 1,7-bisphosphate phosphatase
MNKAIFLDRDGVINDTKVLNGIPVPPQKIEELSILPKVNTSLIKLIKLKFKIIVITNQPDVARGKIKKETVDSINNYLMKKLPLDNIYTCFHDDSDYCDCRKPKPGAILKASKKYNIDLSQSFMIGDRWKDIEAGKKAGCKTIFINYNYSEKKPNNYDYKVSSLYEASQIIEKTN